MSVPLLSSLLKVRQLQAERARMRLSDAVMAERAARDDETCTHQRTAASALERQNVLAEMGRQVGAVREIYKFAALTEDHAIMLDREVEVRRRAAEAVEHSSRVVQEIAAVARQAQRTQEKTTELLAVMRRAKSRDARRAMTRREEEDAGAGSK
ncbi:hypothetical protein [Tabrizicola aquatica]|uniref:hypothetical protein n=1 Tax=Tabrizicola aquatica TaxID=909926 RepID=UPI0011AED534|nr:hypothetical protein [Tabrizicola aquatica]